MTVNYSLEHRIARLRELGLGDRPDSALDAFARRLGEATKAPYAMINFTNDEVEGTQYFAGLYVATNATASSEDALAPKTVSRNMPRDHGYCPHVLEKEGRALALHDVTKWAAFGANEVHDRLNINSYYGIGLVDERTNTMLGTFCIVDTVTRDENTRQEHIDLLKAHRRDVMEYIHESTGGGPR
ncbi:GAF domain-containing protein [Streptomyces sp. TR02-1]|uniref:GAF domain-containing protein n=1 Tax=Streptomyces sp. TR02-1 TaxID=3385977 RepID=UPI0039A0DB45